MRFRFPFLLILLFLSASSFAESMDDLVKRGGLYYKKFTDTPFTGRVTVDQSRFSPLHYQGSLVNGKREGPWVTYKSDGRLWMKSSYKNGKQEGHWEEYWTSTGQLSQRGHFKDGKQEGLFDFYWEDGRPRAKGRFRNGKFEGSWVFYKEDGSIDKSMTGVYKNDKKISD